LSNVKRLDSTDDFTNSKNSFILMKRLHTTNDPSQVFAQKGFETEILFNRELENKK
jgi:hypothetical protein